MIHRQVRFAAAAAALLIAGEVAVFAQPRPGEAMPGGAAKPLPFVSPIRAIEDYARRNIGIAGPFFSAL